MGSLPELSLVSGAKRSVPTAPLAKHMACHKGNQIALVYADEASEAQISYSELQARSNALARAIVAQARSIGPNQDGDCVVAVCMKPTHNTLLSLLAIWKAGMAYVPMEPSFPQQRINHIITDVEPALIIYDDNANASMFSVNGTPAVSFDELSMQASSLPADDLQDEELLQPPTNDSIAIILYTSGSTGIPKGVRLSYTAICNRLWWQFRAFPYSDTEGVCVWKTALTFVDSVAEIWGPLIHGRTLMILPRETTKDPQKLVRVLAENQIERLVLVPTLLRSILMYLSLEPSKRELNSLKLWVCSGETLSKELAGQFFKYFGNNSGFRLANFYGSTEVMGDVTYYVLERSTQLDMHDTVPIGLPVDNCSVYLTEGDAAVRAGAPGALHAAGASLATGYVRRHNTAFTHNAHATHPDFARLYRTGDFARLEKGVLLYAGRTDSQVKIRGHRVDLQEVDRAVAAVDGVDKSVVLCYGLERGSPELLAFVTLTAGVRTSARLIEADLTNKLTSYMIPQVIVIDMVPLLVNGKVDRQALLKMYENTNNNDDSAIALDIDYTGVEVEDMDKARVLFETVGEVLGRAVRGALTVRAGFYELGGNSLNSIYTITKLRERGYYVDISDFLGASNLGEILSCMSSDSNSNEDKQENKFTAHQMMDEHKRDVIEMIVTSFYEKAELEQFLKAEITRSDYADCIEQCWEALIKARLSVVLTDASGAPVAVALNFDARLEPEIQLSGGLAKIMAFLEYVEGHVRDTMLPKGTGTVLHSFMMATSERLSARDNVSAIRSLEHATLRRAHAARFHGLFTTNTSPLTQQLGTDVLGFKTLLDYQINQYVTEDGERIFGKAEDDMRVIVCWKPIEY